MALSTHLDHVAFFTADTAATYHFYVEVMGWRPASAWGRDDDNPPFFITGYDAGGFLIEFEEQVGVEPPRQVEGFPHFGFAVFSDEELDAWREQLREHDVAFQDFGTQVMFTDPNGVGFQILRKQWHGTPEEAEERSSQNLAAWLSR